MVVTHSPYAYRSYIAPGILLTCLLIAIATKNRAFIIGYGVGIMMYWLLQRERNIKQWQVIAGFIGTIVLVAVLAIFVKSDSTAGRLLIYKVSFAMFKDHWLTGIGWGNFKAQYLYYQANYFATAHYTAQELLLAGNTYFAFNDYWQLIIELGITGMLIILVMGVGLTALIQHMLKIQTKPPLYVPFVISQMVASCIAACFTHVFEKEYMQILMIVSIATLLFYIFFRTVTLFYIITCSGIICVGICHNSINFYILHYKQYKQWQDASESARSGYLRQAKQTYASLYSDLKQYPLFLNDYSNVLIATEEYVQAQSVLSKLILEEPQNTYYANLGACYLAMHHVKSAEQAYQTAINMVPNRFIPRFELYKLYHDTGQQTKAKLCANEILNLPVKVPSSQITFILERIKRETKTE